MGGKFFNVTQGAIEAHLFPQGFKRMSLPNTHELVYGKVVKKGNLPVSMRVYTAINDDNGMSRKCGSDAMRVSLFVRYDNEAEMVGKPVTVSRTDTWAKRLQVAIDRWEENWQDCPACGNPMTLRKGKHGEFWSCVTWRKTKCNGKPRVNQPVPRPAPKQKDDLYDRLMSRPQPQQQPEKPKQVRPAPQVSNHPQNNFRIPANQISDAQRRVEDCFRRMLKNIVMESRAGGGKTTMLKHLASYRPSGHRMVYLAFNRRNASEGKKKLPREVPSMTTHAFCGRMLRDNGLKLPEKADNGKNFIVMEDVYPGVNNKDRRRIRKAAFKLIGLSKNFAIRPGDVEGIKAVMNQYSFNLEEEDEYDQIVEITNEVLKLSVPTAKFGSLYDYDDMLWWPVVLDFKPTFYHEALLDEVQDFNACQIELVARMVVQGTRCIAVGDPYQAVYRFRGADSDAFFKVSAALATGKEGCETILLPTNYRCGSVILDYVRATTVVKDIEAAPGAPLGEVRVDLSYDKIIDLLVEEYRAVA